MTQPDRVATFPYRVSAQSITDGAGVRIHRGIGTTMLRHLDPFLMLDHFGSSNPDDYVAGFPAHPHRGFTTLTYMIDGHMLHEDSMNNRGHLRAGDVQWMKAASGIIHSEMPQQESGLMRGFQLWINLPAAQKMSEPAYQEFASDLVPSISVSDGIVKVIAGKFRGHVGPVIDDDTQLSFFDVTVTKQPLTDLVGNAPCSLIYVFDGEIDVVTADQKTSSFGQHEICVLSNDQPVESVAINARGKQARFVLIAGRPIGEPIVQQGPFVMNTTEEIRQAVTDFQNGQLVRHKASVTRGLG